MTNTTITNSHPELTKNYIIQLLDQLTIDYQNMVEELKLISAEFSTYEDQFTILEEIELLTTDIRGYASQIKFKDYITNAKQVIEMLQQMRLFDIPILSKFYFNNSSQYPNIKSYLRMLDYLRLLIIEYLNFFQVNQ